MWCGGGGGGRRMTIIGGSPSDVVVRSSKSPHLLRGSRGAHVCVCIFNIYLLCWCWVG